MLRCNKNLCLRRDIWFVCWLISQIYIREESSNLARSRCGERPTGNGNVALSETVYTVVVISYFVFCPGAFGVELMSQRVRHVFAINNASCLLLIITERERDKNHYYLSLWRRFYSTDNWAGFILINRENNFSPH